MKLIRSAFLIAALALAAQAQGAILYENGTHSGINSGNNPFSYGDRYVAMDFNLNSVSNLGAVTFNAFTKQVTLPITNVGVKIYSNVSGNIGNELYAGNFGVLSQAVTGTIGSYTLRDFTVALPNWSLNAGTYWIGLQADPAQWDMHWSIVNQIGYQGKIGNNAGTSTSYVGYGMDHYFNLASGNTVPEPATIALLGFGLLGMGAARRKSANDKAK